MLTTNALARLLVKTTLSGQSVQLTASDGTTADFTIESLSGGALPLPGATDGATGATTGQATSVWQVWTLTSPLPAPSLWDLCHQLISGTVRVDGGPAQDGSSVVAFAEPDFPQNWGIGNNHPLAVAAARPGEPAAPEDNRFPTDPDNYWFRNADHAQFDAVSAISTTGAETIRVAHLDTGYDPSHASTPANLNHDLEANCVDGRVVGPGSAVDDSTGLLTNLGHGTGTLGILAGQSVDGHALGGAPDVEVVPIRVANSVILFFNSAITRAFDYVLELCADPATRVHVVTMSMGGVPSFAWADYVNQLYDAGVFIVTASGNNYANLPIHTTVYPALFNRVVAACGVMANGAKYADLPPLDMAGNYGPPDKMTTAMSAYTPNVPWARYGSDDTVDFNGSGTSAATPQIAAAAALWLQQHQVEWTAYPEDWMRVEAVRKALFDAASKSADTLHFGQGLLRAADALGVPAAPAADLIAQPLDTLTFPLTGLLPAAADLNVSDVERQMLAVEALQLSHTTTNIERMLPGRAVGAAFAPVGELTSPAHNLQQVRATLLAHPVASRALKMALKTATPSPPTPSQPTKPSRSTSASGSKSSNGSKGSRKSKRDKVEADPHTGQHGNR